MDRLLEVSDQQRARLATLLAERPSSEQLLGRLSELRRLEAVAACAAVVRELVHVDLEEEAAERWLRSVLKRRDAWERSLGRDPGLVVAALDQVTSDAPMIAQPIVVDSPSVRGLAGRLPGREAFRWQLEREIGRSRRQGGHVTLSRLELDGFAEVEQRHGEVFGALLEKRLERVVRDTARETDLCASWGGGGIGIALPHTGRLGADALGGRIRAELQRELRAAPVGGHRFEPSLSAGIALFPADADHAMGLIARAETALTCARGEGGDRSVLFHAEKRRTIRRPARPDVHTRLSFAPPVSSPARLLDISRSGARIATSAPCRADGRMRLTLSTRDTSGERECLVAWGRVVRTRERTRERTRDREVGLVFDRALPLEWIRELATGSLS